MTDVQALLIREVAAPKANVEAVLIQLAHELDVLQLAFPDQNQGAARDVLGAAAYFIRQFVTPEIADPDEEEEAEGPPEVD